MFSKHVFKRSYSVSSPNLTENLKHAIQMVKTREQDNYLATLLAPKRISLFKPFFFFLSYSTYHYLPRLSPFISSHILGFRPAIFTLRAFNIELSTARDTVSDLRLGDMRLQWYKLIF